METNMRGRCPVPMLNVRGRIRLDLSTDNKTWTHPTIITVGELLVFYFLYPHPSSFTFPTSLLLFLLLYSLLPRVNSE